MVEHALAARFTRVSQGVAVPSLERASRAGALDNWMMLASQTQLDVLHAFVVPES